MNCGRCSNEKKRTVTVAVLSQRRYFPIPAVSGHQIGVEGFLEFLEIFHRPNWSSSRTTYRAIAR
ncbi:hypothetical protein RchiOBHm_Chr5g0065521 [Rosa chinensis]|uniref:Uncharacterized protein n=2 Tax=Rosa chinensis TaxID=74649 RepID=A0A2P6PQJ9_ROSCH|nr:hypothetical protein RchiOBHm_Chr6g0269791 [Rosa chinensis]PRQ34138.1 hypothetical protein RchiOBHm_Chr5g0065521 [Rosa chinensis]